MVIGTGGRYIRAAEALSAVAGYVVVMDGTAREWQRVTTQWTPGKNFDQTMPIGPEMVTADELDPSDLQITTTLNGEVMQSASTAQMIYDIPQTIEYVSSFTTLRPGDVIATGTPGGVGFARKPPVWLTAGDRLEVAIEGVGRIANRIVDEACAIDGWPWMPPESDRTRDAVGGRGPIGNAEDAHTQINTEAVPGRLLTDPSQEVCEMTGSPRAATAGPGTISAALQ